MASKRSSRLLKILAGGVADAEEVFQLEGRPERFAHFWALVVRQFIRHHCFVRASALSYSTLLALIPLLAVTLNVTSSLLSSQGEEKLAQFVEHAVSSIAGPANVPTNSISGDTGSLAATTTNSPAEQRSTTAGTGSNTVLSVTVSNAPTAAGPVTINTQTEVAKWIHDLVEKTRNGALGIFGMIGLIVTSISLLRGIEDTFNDMWGVTHGRHWLLQITLYWTIITLGPLLLSTGLALSSSRFLENTLHVVESSSFLAPVLKHLFLMAVLSIGLGLFYKFTPNTTVRLNAAMVGGVFAGVAWHGYNQLSFVLASRALSTSKLYGSIFLFVLLMVGLYFLWVIILFGAQVAYAYQNRFAYLQERLAENVNHRGREFVALRIMTFLGRRFQNGERPATVPEISAGLGIPSRLTQTVLRTLAATQLVTETCGDEAAFVPARPLDAINAHDILMAMRTGTGQELPVCEMPELAEIYGEFARIEQAERNAAASVTLLVLANRTMPRLGDGKADPERKPAALAEPKAVEAAKAAGAVAAEKMAEAEPVELPKPAAFPEKIEMPEKPPEDKQALAEQKEPPRRESARPEDMDFPL